MAKLTSKRRNALPGSAFAGPDRSYPIPDESHARNALARVSQFGTSALKAKVRRLEEDNEILRRASIFFAGELDPRSR